MLDAGGAGFDVPVSGEDEQAGGVRALRIDRLPEQQRLAGALGKVRGSGLNEALLGGIEHRLVGFPVETERGPDLAALCAQGRHHFLVATQRDVGLPAWATARVAVGRLVEGGDATLGARHVHDLIDVVAVVLEGERVRW